LLSNTRKSSAPASLHTPSAVGRPKRPRICVVDDDEAVRDSLRLLLEANGYRVKAFSDCKTFLDSANFEKMTCVVLDINFPGLNGLEALSDMRSRGAALPVIIVSAHLSIAEKARAESLGVTDIFLKPVYGSELIDTVAKIAAREKSAACSKATTVPGIDPDPKALPHRQ
jgi:FixJ family two-component response regulator